MESLASPAIELVGDSGELPASSTSHSASFALRGTEESIALGVMRRKSVQPSLFEWRPEEDTGRGVGRGADLERAGGGADAGWDEGAPSPGPLIKTKSDELRRFACGGGEPPATGPAISGPSIIVDSLFCVKSATALRWTQFFGT